MEKMCIFTHGVCFVYARHFPIYEYNGLKNHNVIKDVFIVCY